MFMDSEEIRVRLTLDFEEIKVTRVRVLPTNGTMIWNHAL